MTINVRQLLKITKHGNKYYSADENGVCEIVFSNGTVAYLDWDIMDYIIENDINIARGASSSDGKIRFAYSEKHVGPRPNIISVLFGIDADATDDYYYLFNDGNHYNHVRSNMTFYRRTTKINEIDGVSEFKVLCRNIDNFREIRTYSVLLDSVHDEYIESHGLTINDIESTVTTVTIGKTGKYKMLTLLMYLFDQHHSIIDAFNSKGIKIKALTRLNSDKLDYSSRNLSVYNVSNKLKAVETVIYDDNDVTNTRANHIHHKNNCVLFIPGLIFGKNTPSFGMSPNVFTAKEINDMMRKANDELHAIKTLSVKDIYDDPKNIDRIISVYNGSFTKKYRLLVQRLKAKK